MVFLLLSLHLNQELRNELPGIKARTDNDDDYRLTLYEQNKSKHEQRKLLLFLRTTCVIRFWQPPRCVFILICLLWERISQWSATERRWKKDRKSKHPENTWERRVRTSTGMKWDRDMNENRKNESEKSVNIDRIGMCLYVETECVCAFVVVRNKNVRWFVHPYENKRKNNIVCVVQWFRCWTQTERSNQNQSTARGRQSTRKTKKIVRTTSYFSH